MTRGIAVKSVSCVCKDNGSADGKIKGAGNVVFNVPIPDVSVRDDLAILKEFAEYGWSGEKFWQAAHRGIWLKCRSDAVTASRGGNGQVVPSPDEEKQTEEKLKACPDSSTIGNAYKEILRQYKVASEEMDLDTVGRVLAERKKLIRQAFNLWLPKDSQNVISDEDYKTKKLAEREITKKLLKLSKVDEED